LPNSSRFGTSCFVLMRLTVVSGQLLYNGALVKPMTYIHVMLTFCVCWTIRRRKVGVEFKISSSNNRCKIVVKQLQQGREVWNS